METHHRHAIHRVSNRSIKFGFIYLLAVIFNFHGLLVAYSNSTFMEQFVSPATVGILFTISSSIAVFAFLFISHVLHKIGNVRLVVGLSIIEIIALIVLGFTSSPTAAIVAFIVFMVLNPLIYLSIDIFSESLIGKNENSTGSKRGLTLTLMSLAAVAAPLALAVIVGDKESQLFKVYLVSAAVFSTFIFIILAKFKNFQDPKYHKMKIISSVSSFWKRKDMRNVFLANFTLQMFFSWMVIYLPLYLATEIGFTWDIIGVIIAIGLFAYVIFEYPVGIIADKWIGEKEMMATGFIIIAITSAWISFMVTASILAWIILMFISRIGASFVEATTESYFFKHTKGTDANIMSFFRLTRPLAMVVGAMMGTISLLFLPFQFIFIVLGFMMVPGIFFSLNLKDTL